MLQEITEPQPPRPLDRLKKAGATLHTLGACKGRGWEMEQCFMWLLPNCYPGLVIKKGGNAGQGCKR